MQNKKKWTPLCDPDCRGWMLAEGCAIETCDECGRFESDDEAFRFAVTTDSIVLRKMLDDNAATHLLEVRVYEAFVEETGHEDCGVGHTGEIPGGTGFVILPLEGHMPLATARLKEEDGEIEFAYLRERDEHGNFLKFDFNKVSTR